MKTFTYAEIAAGMYHTNTSYIIVKDTLVNLGCSPNEADEIIEAFEKKEGSQFGQWDHRNSPSRWTMPHWSDKPSSIKKEF